MDGGDHGAGLVVETVGRICVTHRHNGAADNRREIHVSFGRDFTCDESKTRGKQSLTSDAAGRVFGEAGVEDGV